MAESTQNSGSLIQPLEGKHLMMPYAHYPPNGPEPQQLLFQQAYRAGFERADQDTQLRALQAQQITDLQALFLAAQKLADSRKISAERKQFWQAACTAIQDVLTKKTPQPLPRINSLLATSSSTTDIKPETSAPAAAPVQKNSMTLNSSNVLFQSFKKLDSTGQTLFCDAFKNTDEKTRLHILGGSTHDLTAFCAVIKNRITDPQLNAQDKNFWTQIYNFLATTLEHRTGKSIVQILNDDLIKK